MIELLLTLEYRNDDSVHVAGKSGAKRVTLYGLGAVQSGLGNNSEN